jgi:hypothetical protein
MSIDFYDVASGCLARNLCQRPGAPGRTESQLFLPRLLNPRKLGGL